ncbi:unnamed protein product [Acanthoscelides obtectus]|uniref:PiggyBac transposable element-derived protein domain-containing protein n=1 Tax=Acanthoscelides obtectus TaxID=200917 RepID=A0A9P0MGE9_ACAOB|nr:unnamed protein product [Acanthoscelides obtectus]CAK1687833.1 hypothetical protein AOBTE_LOCUS36397 [Acanthoscelides obtectus]
MRKFVGVAIGTGLTQVYTGKGDTQPELGRAQSIVLKLLEDVNPKEGRILYDDNIYSGIPLVPKEFTKKNKKGEVIGKEKSKIKIIKWVDKRPVFMITTHPAHNATLVPTARLCLNYYWARLR